MKREAIEEKINNLDTSNNPNLKDYLDDLKNQQEGKKERSYV